MSRAQGAGRVSIGERSLDLDLGVAVRPFEVEDPEGAAHHVDGDVEDGHRPDPALEGTGVGVAVQDEVGPVLGDRDREPVGAEKREDPLRLALERVRGRCVVEQDDPQVAVADLLQPGGERLDLRGRLRLDLAQQPLAEVR